MVVGHQNARFHLLSKETGFGGSCSKRFRQNGTIALEPLLWIAYTTDRYDAKCFLFISNYAKSRRIDWGRFENVFSFFLIRNYTKFLDRTGGTEI
jgi:hypothetical protein